MVYRNKLPPQSDIENRGRPSSLEESSLDGAYTPITPTRTGLYKNIKRFGLGALAALLISTTSCAGYQVKANNQTVYDPGNEKTLVQKDKEDEDEGIWLGWKILGGAAAVAAIIFALGGGGGGDEGPTGGAGGSGGDGVGGGGSGESRRSR